MESMNEAEIANDNLADPLIDEARAIRRSMCEEFGNDLHKLADHLGTIEEEYRSRTGRFARVPREINEAIFPLIMPLPTLGT